MTTNKGCIRASSKDTMWTKCPDCEQMVHPNISRDNMYSDDVPVFSFVSMSCPECGWKTPTFNRVKKCREYWENFQFEEDKIRNCPHCGCSEKPEELITDLSINPDDHHSYIYLRQCANCGFTTPKGVSPEEALKNWNEYAERY